MWKPRHHRTLGVSAFGEFSKMPACLQARSLLFVANFSWALAIRNVSIHTSRRVTCAFRITPVSFGASPPVGLGRGFHKLEPTKEYCYSLFSADSLAAFSAS